MRTKDKILVTALQLLNEHGVKSVTIRDIAAEMGISHGNLGYHYANMELIIYALGASSASERLALDRHWRNARTVATHNPLVYKARIVGDWAINGTEPPYVWQIGGSPAAGK